MVAAGLIGGGAVLSREDSNDLQFWNLFGGGDGERLAEMTDAYRANNPRISLTSTTLAWGAPYYTKLAMAAAGGRPPDVAIVHASRLSAFAPANLVEPFDPALLAKYQIGQDQFLPTVWSGVQSGGRTFAIPLDTHPWVLYYNKDICRQAGLLDANDNLLPLVGTEALLDAFSRSQQVTGGDGVSIPTDSSSIWRWFWSCYRQLGGEMLSSNATQITLDDAKTAQVLDFMTQMTLQRKVASPVTDYQASVALFSDGKVGFHFNGEWEITTFLANPELSFNMVPLPDFFGTGNLSCFADSHSFVLPRQASVDPARRELSYQFIQQMLSESLTWAKGGHIPAYLPVATSPQYADLRPQSNYASAAQNAAYDPNAWFSGAASELENQTGTAFTEVIKGTMSPPQGISQLRKAVQNLIDTPSPI